MPIPTQGATSTFSHFAAPGVAVAAADIENSRVSGTESPNTYEVARYDMGGLFLTQVCGPTYCIEDLFKMVGRDQHHCKFRFREGSEARATYGPDVDGAIAYSLVQREALENGLCGAAVEKSDRLMIRCYDPELSPKVVEALKYHGVALADLQDFDFVIFPQRQEFNEDGTKKVPNVVYIDLPPAPDIDVDLLLQNLLVSKHNDGTELLPYEKARLIGVTLGRNDGRIDSRILETFGFDASSAAADPVVSYSRLKTKAKRTDLSPTEKEQLRNLEAIRLCDRLRLLGAELLRSGATADELRADGGRLNAIQSALMNFEPQVLLLGKKQVYWDLESYFHIVLRHVKELQLGQFKAKTAFPYQVAELKTLVEKVLSQIEAEIARHFEQPPPHNQFIRQGRMSVLFNGDYFTVRINEAGRLVTIYVNKMRAAL